MAKHIETKCDEVSGTSKWAIEERHQGGDGGSRCWNGRKFHDWLLDEPNSWKLYDNEYALDNIGIGI